MDGITAAHVDTIVSAGGRTVYALANQRLFVTRDGGGEWRDLTDSLDGFVPRLLATIGDGAVYVHARRRGSAADDRLFRVSESEGARIAVDGPPVSSIRCMAARPDGTLFFCTDEPEVLHRLNPDMGMTRSDISIRSVIRQLTVTPDGGLYASTGRGLFFTTDDGTSWTAAMEGRAFTTLALTSRGMPILLSRVPMRPIDGKWELLPPQASIDARSIAIDPSDVIYIEGGYHPMCSRDFGETWSTIYYGLRPWATTVVAADEDGDVFLGTPANGIYRRN